MIAWLSGKLLAKEPSFVVVDVGGVGYSVFVSLQTFCSLPAEGAPVKLSVHTSVREDAIQLYGFESDEEKKVFEKLLGVSKIGPKVAITILSGIPAPELIKAIGARDVDRLSSVPGVGKKTAERLVVELSDKIKNLGGDGGRSVSTVLDDVVEALVSLGYKKNEAQRAARLAAEKKPKGGLQEALKEALKFLA